MISVWKERKKLRGELGETPLNSPSFSKIQEAQYEAARKWVAEVSRAKSGSFQASGSEAEQQEKAEETTCTPIPLKSQLKSAPEPELGRNLA